MALPKLITALLFVLAFAKLEISTCYVVKGKASCLDCSHNDVFSGLQACKSEGKKVEYKPEKTSL
ncbi:hypothetical protein CFP56_036128 [Quercus suber]|uniref:Uncharacterized protein n=1 Tax=Quercus suber TaxID=58331 RepID=A0AAW0LPN9_QUESU